MMKISVWDGGLSDSYLKQVTQLGADYIDFGRCESFPGVKEEGYPDLDELLKIRKRIRSWGLDINRVTLPNISDRFMKGHQGGDLIIAVFGQPGRVNGLEAAIFGRDGECASVAVQ